MAGRRGDTHRLIRWLWTSRRIDARVARTALLPVSLLWRSWMRTRATAYARGWLPVHDLPLPAVAVGNLTVGGSGKTPLAIWIARRYAAQGIVPGILLRPYGGGDEAAVHAHAVPGAHVIADADRVAGAERALARGAQVLVLDDAFQRLDVRRDLNLLVISAETTQAVHWSLPAGPWREGLEALGRADLVIITRKRASHDIAETLLEEVRSRVAVPVAIVHLGLVRLEGLLSAQPVLPASLAGRRVVAAAAIGDPEAFVTQMKATGAAVQVATWKNHHEYRQEDIAWLAHAARRADHLVITEKDAVKLRDRWPADAPEPLVAVLDLTWEAAGDAVALALDTVVTPPERL
ncbi:MAG: tetraacyldisaccharide 4'-kinase [Gemmatimonadota bacterium]|nr:tetraacyldisaccharide 4'-kinase [Gemmatimonadota bacterium]